MFAAALIVFREVLEAALIVTIILAATRGVLLRERWVGLGIFGGVVGAMIIAAMTNSLSSMFDGAGQEILNASILGLAVVMISWHVVWMSSHGRKLASDMRSVGHSVRDGAKHMSVLAVVVGLAVVREGAEVVLMLQGLAASGQTGAMLGGAALGLAAGILSGAVMYIGFVVFPIQKVFSLTNGFLTLIAAGMAARAANFLAQVDLLPSFGNQIWDTSGVVPEHSLIGQFLSALTGYIAQPSGIEIGVYVVTLAAIAVLTSMTSHKAAMQPSKAAQA